MSSTTPAPVTPILPGILSEMQFDVSILDREPRPLDLIDGHVLPRGTVTLVATDPGSGKSTSALISSIKATNDGEWTMFGHRKHEKPLRAALVLGEDNERSFENAISMMPPGIKQEMAEGCSSGRLMISPFRKFARKHENPDFFDVKGKVSQMGQDFFRAMRAFQPDVIVLDTITSLSSSPYLDKNDAYSTINSLNDFADELDCAIIVMMHLTKEGSSSLTSSMSADDLTNKIAGSAGWKGATRHALALAKCPAGKFDNIGTAEGDSKWVMAVKTNAVEGADNMLFPVIRSRSERMLKTTDDQGDPLLMSEIDAEEKIQKQLRNYIEVAVRAAAELRTPFAQSNKNKFGIPQLCTGTLVDISVRASTTQYERAIAALERMGKIVACKTSRAGGAAVWDTPDGAFANEDVYETATGGKLVFRKGAPSAKELEERIADIRERNPEKISELSKIDIFNDEEDVTSDETPDEDTPPVSKAVSLDDLTSGIDEEGDEVPF